ncbi:putative signal transduction histidine kinase with GAF domain [Fulvimarina pelagi HTCC2506]|uniref:Blue-light-activated histidine kinase n=1 Tax=Fulvimarina pelagi HTCC2506 TaxID=314231 RepID=Q0G2R6_9HYPH|nr:GAF domain-containing protein [Fulvimarina pelagi]EAU42115.1 putative signal transduction histidine kinase with GAF domain [Fulvimarina pelagi HTCC2506]
MQNYDRVESKRSNSEEASAQSEPEESVSTRLLDPIRLAALDRYDILDTPPEKGFDDIVHLARRLFDVPVALVSLVDRHRQWFKARSGFELSETPIAQSVCAHALSSRDVLVIPDLTKDLRTASNTLVTGEPKIRFYAGAPLVTPDGHVLGTLCIIDVVSRPQGFSVNQAEDLKKLADQVVALLEMRLAVGQRDNLLRQAAEARTRAEEDRRRMVEMFEQAPSFMAMLRGPDHRYEYVNQAYRRMVGNREVLGRTVTEALPDAAEQGVIAILDQVFRTGETFVAEAAPFRSQPNSDNPSTDIYVDFVCQPVRDLNGEVTGIFIDGSDVTERERQIRRQTALAELGGRLRDVRDVDEIVRRATASLAGGLAHDRIGFGSVDVDSETILIRPETRKPGVASIAGTHAFRNFGSFIENLKRGETVVIPDVRADVRTADAAEEFAKIDIGALLNMPVVQGGRLVLVVFVQHIKPHEWSDDELWFIRQIADRTQAAIAQIEAEAQQEVLNQELSHRLKNTLAMVQAIASQTLRGVSERDAVEAFSNRIQSLSVAHDVLLQKSWTSARVREIVKAVLAPFERSESIDFKGSDLRLGAKAALTFSLIIHELGTNALKYGALSVPEGKVEILWSIEGPRDEAEFVFRWSESGGPPAREPRGRRGFGSRLIRIGLTGTGGVETSYADTGLAVVMKAPLALLQQS